LLEHLVEEAEVDEGLEGLKRTVAEWKNEAVASGAGAIFFDFSAFGAGTPMHASLKRALVSAEAYIKRAWDDEVPPAILNRHDSNVVRFTDYPTTKLVDVLRRLRRLIGDSDVSAP
jgi:hypothetical protein